MMSQHQLLVASNGRGFIEISKDLRELIEQGNVRSGQCHCFIHHTSASMTVMENADPAVLRDLERFMSDLAPDGDPRFEHTDEGPDDMPAHVRAALTLTDVTIPIREGQLDLGAWQGIFIWEHRHRPQRRRVTVTITGISD